MSMNLLTLGLTINDMSGISPIVTLAIINGVVLAFFNWRQLLPQKFKTRPATWWFVVALSCLITAVYLKYYAPTKITSIQTSNEYSIFHSVWHLTAAAASSALHLFLDVENPMYHHQNNDNNIGFMKKSITTLCVEEDNNSLIEIETRNKHQSPSNSFI
jgi:hypothetical protein